MSRQDLGFLSLISIVIGSQVGSGVFVFPSLLAPFGPIGLWGWLVSALGAISLALIFADLSAHLPQNGGPHVYVMKAFGRKLGFFIAWIYWIISWSSNSILLVTTIYYLCNIVGELSPLQIVLIETVALFAITYVNIMGIRFSGVAETIFTLVKVVPLLLIPIILFISFNADHFTTVTNTGGSYVSTIAKTALLTCWGFIGVECATAPAGSVKNPRKTIPRALIIGTICVAMIFIMNSVAVFGISGFETLLHSKAPYALATESIFGRFSNILISILAIIVCMGTLNAWTLTGGQIAQGAADDGLFPPIFGKTNKNGAPVPSLLMAAFGIIPFFIVEQICGADGLDYLIGLLVSIFLFVYITCCISYIKMIKQWKARTIEKIKAYSLSVFAILFCVFVVIQDIISSIIVLFIFIIIGVPVYLKIRTNK
jgi:APA family basic amino acid/polyamine antiporter